jgi:hypothetical protein
MDQTFRLLAARYFVVFKAKTSGGSSRSAIRSKCKDERLRKPVTGFERGEENMNKKNAE